MDEDLPWPAIHGQVGEDHLRSGIVVPTVVWRELVRPHQRAVLWPAGQDAGGPLVVAGALLGIVRRRIPGAVVEQVEVRIVGHPSPHRRTTILPHVGGPARERQLGAPIVERLECSRLREDLAIGTDVVGGPYDPARLEAESHEPAEYATLSARLNDDITVLL